tara:strand:+ start:492 stop:1904 length:1413 start_codon:yes stop_codon:yes gene_type:complete
MPKIPTFTATGTPTDRGTGVTTNIQISPTSSTAAALLPALDQVTTYGIKKRDVAEKVEANKKIFEMKGEFDKFMNSEKENINEDDAINNFKNKYNQFVNSQLSLVTNKRVKERIKQGLDIEYGEYIYNIKKNSFAALEGNAIENINNDITSLNSKYASTDDVKLKLKYKSDAENKIKQFAIDFELPENVLEKKLQALDKKFLLADINQFAGSPDGAEAIKLADDTYGGEKTLDNLEFGSGVYNSYVSAISSITIKNDPNSDYEEALDLIDELKSFERSNGYKVNTGSLSVKIDDLEQKILTEKITHDKNMRTLTINKELNEFTKDLEGDIQKSVAGSALDPFTSEATEIAASKAVDEFKTKMKIYVATYPDATLPEKKAYATSQAFVITNKYDDMNIQKLSEFDVSSDEDNLTKYNTYMSDMQLFSEGKLSEDKIKEYEELATSNGYQGDINLFMNDYLPLLASQFQIGD